MTQGGRACPRCGAPVAAAGSGCDRCGAPAVGAGAPDPAGRPRAPSWREWVRAHPVLAGSVAAFCLLGPLLLVLSAPRYERPASVARRVEVEAPADTEPAPPVAPPAETGPAAPPGSADSEAEGVWSTSDAPPPSPRGLALVYQFRTLPAGESRYGWVVRLAGERAALDTVDLVTYRMDPPAKNGEEFVSRDRAAEGFPLWGHGPGGWFAVTAAVRYRDGESETLARRIELPDPE